MRADAAACGIREINQRGGALEMKLAALDFSAVSALCAEPSLRGRVLFSAGDEAMLTYKMAKGEDPLKAAQSFLRSYRGMMTAGPVRLDGDFQKS